METKTQRSAYYRIRKFVYLTACALLGIVLFLFIEQLLIQLLLILNTIGFGGIQVTQDFLNLSAYAGGILALGLGAWYGVWLGSYWHGLVYEGDRAKGFLFHVKKKLSKPKSQPKLSAPKIMINQSKPVFNTASWQMEDLVKMEKQNISEKIEPSNQPIVKKPRAAVKKVPAKKIREVGTAKVASTTTKKKATSSVKRKTVSKSLKV